MSAFMVGVGSGPDMDWKETPEAHIFMFDLPGLTREDVKLQVHDDRVLHISAVVEEDGGGSKWHCRERLHPGSFSREFRLPENAIVDEIKATMSDGVLVVRVAKDVSKKKTKHPNKYAVQIDAHAQGEDSVAAKGIARFVCCKP